MRVLALLVLTVAMACGGSSKPAPATPPPAPDPIPTTTGPACDVVADKLAIVIHADKPDAQASARDGLRRACTDDAWADDARSCFATVETDDELDGCRKHLSDAQKPAFEKLAPPRDSWTGAPVESAPAAAAAPPPAAAPAPKKRSTRGASPKGDSADPGSDLPSLRRAGTRAQVARNRRAAAARISQARIIVRLARPDGQVRLRVRA